MIVKFRPGNLGGGGLGSISSGPGGGAGFVDSGHVQFLRNQTPGGSQVHPVIDDTYVVQLPQGSDREAEVARLQAQDTVEYAEVDPVAYALYEPNDPGYAQQWAYANTRSSDSWDIGQGSRNVVVAEIDTGVDYTHPDLQANIYTDPMTGTHGYNFVGNTADPMADDSPHFHGTHVAGSIGAIGGNGLGVIGQSPNVTILPLKFLASNGSGNVSDAVRAIYYGIQKGVKVMSNSWGSSQSSQTLGQAIEAARQAGILFVVAAGNGDANGNGQNNDQLPTYPANYTSDNVIAVAATDSGDQLTRFSNYGAHTVHVAAPGLNIYSTKNGSDYQFMSGTSMATPLVSGLAAQMMALRPDLSYREIKAAIVANVDVTSSLQGRLISGGRVNAYKAMAAIRPQGPTPTPSPVPTPTPTSPAPTPTLTPPAPTPTPPAPTPVPTSPPVAGVAMPPGIDGQYAIKITNPYGVVEIEYDVSQFPGTVQAYIEVSRPGVGFSNPNGNSPDPYRLNYRLNPGARGAFRFIPAQDLRSWGVFEFRVIGLDGRGMPTSLFSDPSVLTLWPN